MRKCILIVASTPESLLNFRGTLINSLIDRAFEVHVASPSMDRNINISEALTRRGVKCHTVLLTRTGLNPLEDLRTMISLYRLMKVIKPNFFLGYTIKPVVWGLKAAHLAGIENRVALITGLGYAFTGKSAGLRKFVQKIARLLYKSSLRKASLIFFQNPDDLNDFSSLGLLDRWCSTKLINGSGVDIEKFSFTLTPPLKTINFLLIARLLGDKGIREYIAAAREILVKYPHARFHLVGGLDTNPNSILEKEVNSWLKEGVLHWHGALSDVRPWLAKSHVYVLPSYREGTPRSVLEAMSMGRPIITTDAPGCRETVIEGQNGFLVDVKSVDQLVVAMERFIKQPELIKSMGKRSREIACEKYDVHKVNNVMLKAMGIIKE